MGAKYEPRFIDSPKDENKRSDKKAEKEDELEYANTEEALDETMENIQEGKAGFVMRKNIDHQKAKKNYDEQRKKFAKQAEKIKKGDSLDIK